MAEAIGVLPPQPSARGMDRVRCVAVAAPLGAQQLSHPLAVDHQRQTEKRERKEQNDEKRSIDR